MSIVDDILENDETFNVTLERTPDLDSSITLAPVDGLVQITNDDGRYHYDDYMVVHNHRGDFAKFMKTFFSIYTNSQT